MPEISDEDLIAFQAATARVTELEKVSSEAEGKLKAYEDDPITINWKKSRDVEKRLRLALEGNGRRVDEDGNLIEEKQGFSQEDVRKMASEETQRALIDRAVSKAKRSLNDADKAIFDRFYGKAITGESVDADSVDTFVDLAMKMATANGGMSASAPSARGRAPNYDTGEKKDFSDSEDGKGLAEKFGFKTA